MQGNGAGIHAPGRCSDRNRCEAGDSDTEPWLCSHNVLLAHAAAVQHFRRLVPDGKISINLNCEWAEPFTSSYVDKVCGQLETMEILWKHKNTTKNTMEIL